MWSVEVEPEVERWIESLSVREFATVVAAIERLAEDGIRLRFPASLALGGGLFELRIGFDRVARRITFYFAADPRIVSLTTFHEQRQNERTEFRRVRQGDATVHC